MITLLLVAAALAWLLWPRGTPLPNPAALIAAATEAAPAPAPAAPVSPAAPDGRAAIDSLLAVRDRLEAAGPLDDASAKSIDTLWLDLLHKGGKK
ncbi:MAG: hypothetical protein KGR24_03385 [Planctomycetes bacterium]|nr:hypothetical protein [Planctomycetota bacterium]